MSLRPGMKIHKLTKSWIEVELSTKMVQPFTLTLSTIGVLGHSSLLSITPSLSLSIAFAAAIVVGWPDATQRWNGFTTKIAGYRSLYVEGAVSSFQMELKSNQKDWKAILLASLSLHQYLIT